MAKKKGQPVYTVFTWVSDKDKRAEVLLTVLVIVLAAALLWPR